MAKTILIILFVSGLLLSSPIAFALNTQLDPSFKPISPTFSGTECSKANGKVSGNNCIFCPSERYHLAQSAGKDICQLEFVAPNTGGSCPSGFPKKDTDQFGKAICVKAPAGVAGCPTGQSQNITGTCEPTQVSVGASQKTDYKFSVEIPCQPILGGTCPTKEQYTSNPAFYIARVYQFGLMIVGLVAFGGLVFGAVKYTLSAGNPSLTGDAKEQMLAAIYGLLLLLGAYLILYTINPDLVSLNFNSLSADPLSVVPAAPPAPSSPGTRQNVLTSGQQLAAPGVSYLTQTGCTRNSNQYRVVINGQNYWACEAAATGYQNTAGIVSRCLGPNNPPIPTCAQ